MSTMKHRFADQLDWADDISMLTSIDNPIHMENLKRKHARAASAYAAGLEATQRRLARQQASQGTAKSGMSGRRPTSAPARQGFGGSGSSALQVDTVSCIIVPFSSSNFMSLASGYRHSYSQIVPHHSNILIRERIDCTGCPKWCLG